MAREPWLNDPAERDAVLRANMRVPGALRASLVGPPPATSLVGPRPPPAPAEAPAARRVRLAREERDGLAAACEGPLRRGHFVIMPPSFSFIWRIPIGTTNESDE